MTVIDEFDLPASYAPGPNWAQLSGRLLIIFARRLEKVFNDQQNKEVDRLTADVVFLDGAPISEKVYTTGTPSKPLDPAIEAGDLMPGMYISAVSVIRACEPSMSTGRPVLGRLRKAAPTQPGRQGAWVLDDPSPEDLALGKKWLKSDKNTATRAVPERAPDRPIENVPAQANRWADDTPPPF